MTAKKLCLFIFLMVCQLIFAQNDSIVALEEVVVSDSQLQRYSQTLSVQRIKDTVIERNQSSLTSLLQFNSVIYFKQNGFGMVASPSLRGSTAQQTAVVWNGININSQLTGQTDFNTISTRDFENIAVRAGGGSALYGSSAIGGSVHLNNELIFKKHFRNQSILNYGSFNTVDFNNKTSFSDEKFATIISISRNSSDNDYEYLGMNGKKNENGQFQNTSLNLSVGYRLNAKHILKLYSQFYSSDRHFSGTIASKSHDMYEDRNNRNLLDWIYDGQRVRSSLKLAYLFEKYRYFRNFRIDDFETSLAETFIAKYNFSFRATHNWEIEMIADYNQSKAIGSNIGSNIRGISSFSLINKYKFSDYLQLESSIRQEITNAYQSPLLYSIGMVAPITKHYRLKVNHSKNFRIPTFNDLYWVASGNINLKPEQSIQNEIGQELIFKDIKFTATVYHNQIQHLIQWKPIEGIWSPENVTNVKSHGLELLLEVSKKFLNHKFDLASSYAYTVSTNEELDTQLTYVPFHKYTASFTYSYKRLMFNYQYLFNGSVFTLNDNQTKLGEYLVSNVGVFCHLGKKQRSSLGLQSLNIWNENYQSVPGRPLPGRNFQINLILKL